MHSSIKYFNMMKFCVHSKCFPDRPAKRMDKIGPILTIWWPSEFWQKNKVVFTYYKMFTGAIHLKVV